MVDTINAHMISFGDDEYVEFVKNVNAMVEVQKPINKSRATRSDNAEEEDKPTTEDGE